MARLALMAMLLLAVMPTLGRVLQARAGADAPATMAMCTAAGMAKVPLSLWMHHDGAAPSASLPSDNPRPHPDCDYCPLLASLVTLAVAALLLAALRLPAQGVLPCVTAPRAAWHPCGLGSRGPPIAL